jgi:hypothetical protein
MNKKSNHSKRIYMRRFLISMVPVLGILTLSSCSMPGVVSNPNNCFPQSVTETHTKTTLVAPPSYNMPYLPPSAIYQSAPVAQPMPMQAPVCQPAPQIYQAAPCQPSPAQYQSYAIDPCAHYQSGYVRQPNAYYAPAHQGALPYANVVPVQAAPAPKPLDEDKCISK